MPYTAPIGPTPTGGALPSTYIPRGEASGANSGSFLAWLITPGSGLTSLWSWAAETGAQQGAKVAALPGNVLAAGNSTIGGAASGLGSGIKSAGEGVGDVFRGLGEGAQGYANAFAKITRYMWLLGLLVLLGWLFYEFAPALRRR